MTMITPIQQAIIELNKGGVIAYPTETILGLGCLSMNQHAIQKIYEIKKRETNKPLLVLVNSIAMVQRFKNKLAEKEKELLLSEEPTTVVLDDVKGFPSELTGIKNSLAFRITKHKTCIEIIESINQPLVSTSVNFSGSIAAKNHLEIPTELAHKIDFIIESNLDSKPTKPSRIVKIINNEIKYIRK